MKGHPIRADSGAVQTNPVYAVSYSADEQDHWGALTFKRPLKTCESGGTEKQVLQRQSAIPESSKVSL